MRAAFFCLLLAAAAPAAGQRWPRYASPMQLDLHIPAKHPYLTLTPERIARARANAGSNPWIRQQIDLLRRQADACLARSWNPLPPRNDLEHRAIGGRLFTAGLAYSFTGESRYAEWVRDGLLAYAAIYPSFPVVRGRNKLFTGSSLTESTWLARIALAYDLVADSGVFTPDQVARVENDILRPSAALFKIEDFENDPRIKDLHFRCYNFQSWHICAVGLAGLAMHDKDLVDWAINSPYGLRHLIGHDINDDGIFWERSIGYHDLVIRALFPLTEAMLHCGVDLYDMTVPADHAKDEDSHYITDVSFSPKSLRMLFESPFYMTFPDLSYPALGDSGHGPMRAPGPSLVAWERYQDPKTAWLLELRRPDPREATTGYEAQFGAEWHWIAYDMPEKPPASFPLHEGRFAGSGEYRNGCSLFPSTGVAVLRQASGDYTSQPDSTAASLSFGPHGGGHGHSDMLNIVLYAFGRQWLPDFGSMPYGSPGKAQWTAQTVSHNTLVVDGISQKPTGKRNVEWPGDNATDRVTGKLDRFDPDAKAVSAASALAYDGVKMGRSLQLSGNALVDAFMVSSDAPHRYDYVLHIDAEFESSTTPLAPAEGKLGEICGYQFVELRRRGTSEGPVQLVFVRDGKRLRLWVDSTEPTEYIVAQGPTNAPARLMPMLIVRRNAPATKFVTVFEPVDPKDEIRAVRGGPDGLSIETPSGTRRAKL